MRHNSDVETFVKAWVERNLRDEGSLSSTPAEIDRLAADLTGAARAEGISGGDLNRALGDIDDYLTEQYRQIGAARS
jgi:hypothetical protein